MNLEAMIEDSADVNVYFHNKRTYAGALATAQKYAAQFEDPKISVRSSSTQDLHWILVEQSKPYVTITIFFDDEPPQELAPDADNVNCH